MSEFHLTYTVSEADFMKAYEAHWKKIGLGSSKHLNLGLIAVVMGLPFLQFSVFAWAMIAAGVIVTGLVLMRKHIYRNAYRQNKKYIAEIDTVFSAEHILAKTVNGESQLNWSTYNDVFESEEFVLLYIAKNSFSIIPKSALGTDIDAFVQLAEQKIKPADT